MLNRFFSVDWNAGSFVGSEFAMPFVQRNWKGEITGVFANPQEDASEELSADDPDLISFLAAHPFPPKMLEPQTDAEREESHRTFVRIEEEHKTDCWRDRQVQ